MHIEDPDEGQVGLATPQVVIGHTWDVVGPFPSGMREYPFLASPLHAFPPTTFRDDPDVDFARRPYLPSETWPSELAEGGRVGWKKFKADNHGWLEVSYPDIRWDQLRSDRGWASLQYQVLLRTNFTVPLISDHPSTSILIDVIQGTEYAFIPVHQPPPIPTKWYNSDVYDFASSRTGLSYRTGKTSNLARTVSLAPGVYTMIVRAHYETRLFGDPKSAKKPERGPVIRMKVQAEVDERIARPIRGLTVVPDVMDGWFMGDWLSLGLRAGVDDAEVLSILDTAIEGFEVSISPTVLRAGQLRSIAVRIDQTAPIDPAINKIELTMSVQYGRWPRDLHWQVNVRQRFSTDKATVPCTMTFASPSAPKSGPPASISYATLILPNSMNSAREHLTLPPVILALHGAGVDASSAFWSDAIPKRTTGWAVLPTGRTEWGEDWHGGSMSDAWAARDALPAIAERMGCRVSSDTLLMGHSNGGQGAWHLAARYPDRVVGASGWLTIHDYVPYTEQVSNHFADPTLMGILRSSLTPYDNDLYASNLVGIPVLAIHGSDDDNVSPRHSRAHLAAIAAWAGNDDLQTLIEVPKKGHFWDDIFKQPKVIQWMDRLPHESDKRKRFGITLTCANPLESGGREGTRILELKVPGRLARLGHINVKKFGRTDAENESSMYTSEGPGPYREEMLDTPAQPMRAYGPMIRLLATEAVFTIVYGNTPALKLLALRIAHDLLVYHRIDAELLDDVEGHERIAEGLIGGSLLCLGRSQENEAVEWMIGQKKIPGKWDKCARIRYRGSFISQDSGIVTLHPHPCRILGLAAIIAGNDVLGTELAARLFPIRTGVMVPDWAIVSPSMRYRGAGGLVGAGFYGHDWGYNTTMSWLDSGFRGPADAGKRGKRVRQS